MLTTEHQAPENQECANPDCVQCMAWRRVMSMRRPRHAPPAAWRPNDHPHLKQSHEPLYGAPATARK